MSAGVGYSFYAIYAAMFVPSTAPGWSSLICFQLVFNGATITAVGLVGDYVGRIYDESKQRPLYVLGDSVNIDSAGCAQRIVWINSPESKDTQQSHLFRNPRLVVGSDAAAA
jgi:dolichol-phosphate mannosyltransferase